MIVLLLALLISLVFISPAVTQPNSSNGGMMWKPQVAYVFFIPEDDDADITTRAMGDFGLGYLLPLTDDGEHNLKVGAGGGGSPGDEGFANAGFKLGYAYAPVKVRNVIFGVTGVFDAVFPTSDLAMRITGEDDQSTWLMVGLQGSLDFTAPGGLPGTLIVGYNGGLRNAPSKFYFAFGMILKPTPAEETVRRSN